MKPKPIAQADAEQLKKLVADLKAMQKTAFLFDYDELKDKDSFYEQK